MVRLLRAVPETNIEAATPSASTSATPGSATCLTSALDYFRRRPLGR